MKNSDVVIAVVVIGFLVYINNFGNAAGVALAQALNTPVKQ